MIDGLLHEFSEFVAGHLGLHFPPERWPDLRRGIRAAAREFGYADETACVRWLMSAPLSKAQIEVLAGDLTVGETYFFREPRTFDALERQVLPELIRARRDGVRRLRIWSAACCTGEEPYSLAILLSRLLPDLPDWNITILATDVNPRFLQKASQGGYGEWSFRGAPAWLKEYYARATSGRQFRIRPEIKRMVRFEPLNLAEDSYPSLINDTNGMDVILCRNVLMYFSPRQAERVVDKLHRCLIEGGWLILGATETSAANAAGFVPVHLEQAILYRKRVWSFPAAAACAVLPAGEPEPERPPEPVCKTAVEPRTARELANEGRLEEALACLDKLVASERLNPQAHYLRAMILQEQGALSESAQALQRTIFLDHQFVLAHFALGNLARDRGRTREADKHFKNALRCLRQCGRDDILPESEGLTAGRLAEIIVATMAGG